jgi:hypothetical protein
MKSGGLELTYDHTVLSYFNVVPDGSSFDDGA